MPEAFVLMAVPAVLALVLVAIHAWLGLQVLERQVIFVDLAMAQVAALGATAGFVLGHPVNSAGSQAWSLLFTLGAAVLFAAFRGSSTRIPREALVGIVYVVAAAAGLVLVDRSPQGTEHVRQLLAGNILTVDIRDVAAAGGIYAASALGLLALRFRAGAGWAGDLAFYTVLGVVVTSSVALAGVLVVFAMLIIPAAIGRMYFDRRGQLVLGWTAGGLASLAGLALSWVFDLPAGPVLVCAHAAALLLAAGLHPLLRGATEQRSVFRRGARAVAGLLLLASAGWMACAPRADQPLLDLAEALVPDLRALYMSRLERTVYDDAARYVDRYDRETERINALEARGRWDGAPAGDEQVMRISSYLRTYQEMRLGERHAQQEVRGRARERNRWLLGLGLGVAALLVAPRRWRAAAPRPASLPEPGLQNP